MDHTTSVLSNSWHASSQFITTRSGYHHPLWLRFNNFEPVFHSSDYVILKKMKLRWLRAEQTSHHHPVWNSTNFKPIAFNQGGNDKKKKKKKKKEKKVVAPVGTDFTTTPIWNSSTNFQTKFKKQTHTHTHTQWWLQQVDDSWKLESCMKLDTRVLGYPGLWPSTGCWWWAGCRLKLKINVIVHSLDLI